MYAALHFPNFHLQARLRHQPALRWEETALLEFPENLAGKSKKERDRKTRILQMTSFAAEAGVELGMTAAQGQARCACLHLLHRNSEDEKATHDILLKSAATLSADFESTAPGMVLVDLSGSPISSQPARMERLGHEMITRFADHELKGRIGFAPNPDLAALAARVAEPVRIFRGSDAAIREQLAPFPLDVIDPPADYRSILFLWGIQTLGEFTALPRDELAERLGPDAAELWDHAAGKRRRLLRLVRPPADFSQTVDLDYEIETLEPLMFLVRRSLETLTARLASAYLASSEISLVLLFADGNRSEQFFRVPDASRDTDLLFRILQTRLEDFSAKNPITGFRLELTPARPGEQPFQLFESTLRDPNRFAETLAQVEALVGSDNVGSPVPLDTHRPDAFAMRPFDPDSMHEGAPDNSARSTTHSSLFTQHSSLPLRRFRPPLPLDLTTRRDPRSGFTYPEEIISGNIRGRLSRRAGPWKLSGDWWEQEKRWTRQEWDVQLEDGSLYRIACCGETPEEKGWFLEGVYG